MGGKTAPQLRSFGFIVSGGFTVVAFWPLVWRHEDPRVWALILGVVLAAMAAIVPRALEPFHRVWMMLGERLGWVNSRIILSVVYYGVVVPVGLVRRVMGSDPMRRHFEPDAVSYKSTRARRPSSHMRHQY